MVVHFERIIRYYSNNPLLKIYFGKQFGLFEKNIYSIYIF